MVKNLQCLKTPQICYLRHAEYYAKNRTFLHGLDHDTLFLDDPLPLSVHATISIHAFDSYRSCTHFSISPFYLLYFCCLTANRGKHWIDEDKRRKISRVCVEIGGPYETLALHFQLTHLPREISVLPSTGDMLEW